MLKLGLGSFSSLMAKSLTLALALSLPLSALANQPIFDGDKPLELTFTADFSNLIENKDKLSDESQFPLTIEVAGEAALAGKIALRGGLRRGMCRFPPFKIEFDKRIKTPGTFLNVKELKLVTHCDSTMAPYGNLIREERLNYQLMEKFSPLALKTREAKIRYVDSSGKLAPIEGFAFFIEDGGDFAKRSGLTTNKTPVDGVEAVDPENLAEVALFQALIGNTDWGVIQASTKSGHNVRIYRRQDNSIVLVPYDFDLAMINSTNTFYENTIALPCIPQKAVDQATEKIKKFKSTAIQLYTESNTISAEKKNDALSFLKSAYERIESGVWPANVLLLNCPE